MKTAALKRLNQKMYADYKGPAYGALKALCEQAVTAAFGGHALIIRPGLIVGPHDPTDRFTYWPERVAKGGDVLAPGRPERQVQFIDVRDLAEWTVRMMEKKAVGIYNANGPEQELSMLRLLEICRQVSHQHGLFLLDGGRIFTESRGTTLVRNSIVVPRKRRQHGGFLQIQCRKGQGRRAYFQAGGRNCPCDSGVERHLPGRSCEKSRPGTQQRNRFVGNLEKVRSVTCSRRNLILFKSSDLKNTATSSATR